MPAILLHHCYFENNQSNQSYPQYNANHARARAQVNAQLHEAVSAAEARATDAEARLAEERESNAVCVVL